jgi:hypothetical protein
MNDIALHNAAPVDERTLSVRLRCAICDGKRLASFRRILVALLVAVGAPMAALSRSVDPTIRHVLTILAMAWVFLFLPTVRLLCMEWRNGRTVESLQLLVDRVRSRERSLARPAR